MPFLISYFLNLSKVENLRYSLQKIYVTFVKNELFMLFHVYFSENDEKEIYFSAVKKKLL